MNELVSMGFGEEVLLRAVRDNVLLGLPYAFDTKTGEVWGSGRWVLRVPDTRSAPVLALPWALGGPWLASRSDAAAECPLALPPRRTLRRALRAAS